ncbi:MAG: hypothetical protein JRN15_20415, partial [Nitrososphaerota archaeon]|nr:hypothetical protein [Nitrososphaerota archaeon]
NLSDRHPILNVFEVTPLSPLLNVYLHCSLVLSCPPTSELSLYHCPICPDIVHKARRTVRLIYPFRKEMFSRP